MSRFLEKQKIAFFQYGFLIPFLPEDLSIIYKVIGMVFPSYKSVQGSVKDFTPIIIWVTAKSPVLMSNIMLFALKFN